MRKEVLFAIAAGVILGVIIAFGVWRANVALTPSETQEEVAGETTEKEKKEEKEEEINSLSISLVKPENEAVVTGSPTLVSGITKKAAWISISAEQEDYIFQATEEGTFEQEVDLVGGVNQIIITAFGEEGESTEENLTVVYSTEFEISGDETTDQETE